MTLRVQSLDGVWETLGVGRFRGIEPEQVQASSNLWGPDTLSASLKIVDAAAPRPDLSPLTPIQLEEDGQVVWSGRILETPASDALAIQAQGWQYHLDDDALQASYVHTRQSDWQDVRSFLATNLAVYTAGYAVNVGGGSIYLAVPRGNGASAGSAGGVYLDLGPDGKGIRAYISYIGGGHADYAMYVRCTNTMGAGSFTLFDNAPIATSGNTVSNTFAAAGRYLEIILSCDGAGGTVTTDTAWLQILSVQIFSDAAYESGGASILKAVDVVKLARVKAPLLNQSNTLLTDGNDFSIPHLADPGYKTPREWMMVANAYEDDILKLGGNDLRSLVMKDRPTVAGLEVGNWSGSSFQDGGNSGAQIYNRVIVEGTGPDGARLSVSRLSSDIGAANVSPGHTADNPSFTTNTATWTATNCTITRDTGVFDSTPASGRWDNTGASDALNAADYLTETLTGTFTIGATHTAQFRLKAAIGLGPWDFVARFTVHFGDIAGGDYATQAFSVADQNWNTINLAWVPRTTTTTCLLRIVNDSVASCFYRVDTVQVLAGQKATIVDRRNFFRTNMMQIGAPLTTAVGTRLADLLLAAKGTPIFKGSLSVQPGGVRRVIGGAKPHPSTLLREAGEMIRLSHLINPNDGSVGRDGRMVSVSYDSDTQTSSIQIDNQRNDFETLLERYGGVAGNVLQ